MQKRSTAFLDVIIYNKHMAQMLLAYNMALQNSIVSRKFTFDRKNREVGVGSDGASANKILYQLEKTGVGDYLFA